jgi:hypothetical protein
MPLYFQSAIFRRPPEKDIQTSICRAVINRHNFQIREIILQQAAQTMLQAWRGVVYGNDE